MMTMRHTNTCHAASRRVPPFIVTRPIDGEAASAANGGSIDLVERPVDLWRAPGIANAVATRSRRGPHHLPTENWTPSIGSGRTFGGAPAGRRSEERSSDEPDFLHAEALDRRRDA